LVFHLEKNPWRQEGHLACKNLRFFVQPLFCAAITIIVLTSVFRRCAGWMFPKNAVQPALALKDGRWNDDGDGCTKQGLHKKAQVFTGQMPFLTPRIFF